MWPDDAMDMSSGALSCGVKMVAFLVANASPKVVNCVIQLRHRTQVGPESLVTHDGVGDLLIPRSIRYRDALEGPDDGSAQPLVVGHAVSSMMNFGAAL